MPSKDCLRTRPRIRDGWDGVWGDSVQRCKGDSAAILPEVRPMDELGRWMISGQWWYSPRGKESLLRAQRRFWREITWAGFLYGLLQLEDYSWSALFIRCPQLLHTNTTGSLAGICQLQMCSSAAPVLVNSPDFFFNRTRRPLSITTRTQQTALLVHLHVKRRVWFNSELYVGLPVVGWSCLRGPAHKSCDIC